MKPLGAWRVLCRLGLTVALLAALCVAVVSPVDASPGERILLVAGNAKPPQRDRPILARLQATGYTVDVVDDRDLPVSVDDVALVVVSTSVNPGTVGDSLNELTVPVLSYEPRLHREIGLSDGPTGENTASTNIRIVDSDHPLAVGRTGLVRVTNGAQRMSYGTPPASAEVVATTHNRANRAVLFAIAADEPLADGTPAPACRIALFPNYAGASQLTAAGTALVDAAIDYGLNCEPVVVIDDDGDGYSPPEDCDDGDASINPEAEDIPNDGIDQDCSGSDRIDVDGDGYSPPEDCDDGDASINPGAEDIPNDGIDQDCSGRDSGGINNVVLIMTDDMSLADLAYMPKTQALIGGQGVTFANAFTNNPLCCPTRATVLTGQRSAHHGVQSNDSREGTGGYPKLDHSNTLATWADADGFTTAHIGKFFNGYGNFDYIPGVNDLLEVPPGWNDWQSFTRTIKPFQYKISDNGQKVQYRRDEDDYYTDVIATRAVETIEESVAANRPLFLWASIHAPHAVQRGPAVPAPRHEEVYDGLELPMSPSFDEVDVSDKPQYIRDSPRLTAADIAELRTRHEARVESLLAADDLVEDVYNALLDQGILDETLLVFTSDNGFLLGEHRRQGKQVPYEESIRVPLLIRGGPFAGGRTIDGLVSNLDLAPTFVSTLGVAPQRTMDGIDLTPAADNPTLLEDRALIIESFDAPTPYMAVRTESWIWVEYDSGERELYDLVADPYQLESRHADPAYSAERNQLEAVLAQLRPCVGAAACDARIDLPPK
jgi:arylsulfatase A-like enzyme